MWEWATEQCVHLREILRRRYPQFVESLRIEPMMLAMSHKSEELCLPRHVPRERVLGSERLFDLPTAIAEVIETIPPLGGAVLATSVKEMIEALLSLGRVHDLDLYDSMRIVMPSEWIDRIPGWTPPSRTVDLENRSIC